MLKEGMKLEAKHTRRKLLASYLPANMLRRERKVSTSNSTSSNGCTSPSTPSGDGSNRKRHSDSGVDSGSKKKKFIMIDMTDDSPNNSLVVNCGTDDSNSAPSEDDRLYRLPAVNDHLTVVKAEENAKEEVVCT